MPSYDRNEAIGKLRQLQGLSLKSLVEQRNRSTADTFKTKWRDWVEQALEAHLELPIGSLLVGGFYDENGYWVFKIVELANTQGYWMPKEGFVMALIPEGEDLPDFFDSHFYKTLRRLAIVGIAPDTEGADARIVTIEPVDLDAPENTTILEEIKADYEQVRIVVGLPGGYSRLTTHMGKWVSPPLIEHTKRGRLRKRKGS